MPFNEIKVVEAKTFINPYLNKDFYLVQRLSVIKFTACVVQFVCSFIILHVNINKNFLIKILHFFRLKKYIYKLKKKLSKK